MPSSDGATTARPDGAGPGGEAGASAAEPAALPGTGRPRQRRTSRTRQAFLAAIDAQITGTRVLGAIALAVLLAGGCFWLVATTGSPVIGVSFIVLALVLACTVYWFIQVMNMFTGRR